MAIADKPAALWTEEDLQELCDERARETPRLEFKRQLSLAAPRDKDEVERDVSGMASAGGGYLIYGVEEAELDDGSRAASALRPLGDGGLYEQLNNVLDGRGDPKVPFDLHAIEAADGGIYLVVEIFGHRRPHMASDGRFYVRRNLLVRRMTEAEVADAYRDRIRRNAAADAEMLGPAPRSQPGDNDPILAGSQRAHRHGLTQAELAMYVAEGGDARGPGWMSVILGPAPLQPDLFDPSDVQVDQLQAVDIENRWNRSEAPLRHFVLTPTLHGFRAQLPPRDDVAPSYLVHVWADGLMEFGTTLEPALRFDDPQANRVVFTKSVAEYAHDYAAWFLAALQFRGFAGRVKAQVAFTNVAGALLGIDTARYALTHRPIITADEVDGPLLESSITEAETALAPWVKRTMDRLYLAAGMPNGANFFGPDGRPTPN
jgi:hypothetical protein